MELPTERVELGDGQWAELYTEVKRITARLHEAELRKHMRQLEDEPLLFSELTAGQKPWPSDFIVNPAAVDQGKIAEVYVLHQVKAWSLGPVTQETLDEMSRELFKRLQKEIDRMYDAGPFVVKSENA